MLIIGFRTGLWATTTSVAIAISSTGAIAGVPLVADITVGDNIRVSTEGRRSHAEVNLTIDPEDSRQMAACSIIADHQTGAHLQGSGARTVLYVSHDSGATWMHAVEDASKVAPSMLDPSGRGKSWDPTCEYGPSGTLYFGTATVVAEGVHRVQLHRSSDGGRTWLEPAVIDGGFDDKPVLITDTRPESPYRGRLYLTYGGKKERDGTDWRALVSFSEDEGRHFSSPVVAQDPGGDVNGGAVLSDGTLVIVGRRPPEVTVFRDGGRTATSSKVAPQTKGNFQCLPSLAADSSYGPYRDRVYVVWCGFENDRSNILLAYSTDRGYTWSEPHIVDHDSKGTPAEGRNTMPVVAVNGEGVVGVTWYDRRDNADNLGYYVRFSASFDGGDTWASSVRVSERPNAVSNVLDTLAPFGLKADAVDLVDANADEAVLALRISGSRWSDAGHYAGLAAGADGVFHALWVDNRTGIEQVWTAPIRVGRNNSQNPVPTPGIAVDITDRVALDFHNLTYQRTGPTAGILAGNVYLINTSEDTLQRPIHVQMLDLTLGRATGATGMPVLQLDPEHPSTLGEGLLNLDAGLGARGLSPRARSGPVPFQIMIRNLKADDPRGGYAFEMRGGARVLGVVSSAHVN